MAESKPKSFYSCLDMTCLRVAPQAVQHLVIGTYAESLGGKVTFYTAENPHSRETHEVMLGKARAKPPFDGIIFYRLAQFLSDSGPHLSALRELLDLGYPLHFAVERIALRTPGDLEAFFPMLSATSQSESRDRERDYFDALLAEAAQKAI